MGLNGQIDAPGFKDRDDGGHPVQVALCHHRDYLFPPHAPRQQDAPELVGTGVEFLIGPHLLTAHSGDAIRVRLHLLLKKLVEAIIRQIAARPGQPLDQVVALVGREQALPSVLGIRISGNQRERGQVIPCDSSGARGVEHFRAVTQLQHKLIIPLCDADPKHSICGQIMAATSRIEDGLERRFSQPQFGLEVIDRKCVVGQQFCLDAVCVEQ